MRVACAPRRPSGAPVDRTGRLGVASRYLGLVALANLAWEFAHMPLYTLWREGSAGEIAFAAVHCTGGDVLIAASSLLIAVAIAGRRRWPYEHYGRVAAAAVAIGLAFTVFSEWLNTAVFDYWAYSELMPIVPPFGTGLSPVLQWIVIPLAAFRWVRHRPLADRQQKEKRI